MKKHTIAIVLAAGQGKRMNSTVKKQYLLIDGKPVLYYSLKVFEESFVDEASRIIQNASYCSHHPMAGKEKVGIEYSHLCRFDDANYLVTPSYNSSYDAVKLIESIGHDLEFKNN